MRLLLPLFLCIFLVTEPLGAAPPVNYKKPDLALLERLTLKAVNKTRKDHDVNTLPFNAILYKAAKNHALYIKKHELGHHQPGNSATETVQKRVEYYGGKDYYAGENVLMVSIRIDQPVAGHKAKTYRQLADALTAVWVNSAGHYRNMINPQYSLTAVALSYQPDEQLLYAVQVFAFRQEDIYPTVEMPASLQKYPHKLKAIPAEKRKAAAEPFCELSTLSLSNHNNRLVMTLTDEREARELQKMIGRRRDGLVIEKVVDEPYRCGNPAYEEQPSRRNGQYFLNGELLEPVFRKELYRQLAAVHVSRLRKPTERKARKIKKAFQRQKRRVPYWVVDLGSIDDHRAAYNIMLIRKKRLIAVQKFYDLPWAILPAGSLPPMRPLWLPGHFNFSPGTAEIRLEIPFALNQSSLPLTEADKLLMIDSLRQLPVQKIDIEAFASVEGDLEINRQLHQNRADFIRSRLQEYISDSTIAYNVKTGENWPEFARQIRYSPYAYLLSENKQNVKEFLRSSTNDTIKALLQKQRKAVVRVSFLDTSAQYDTLTIVSNEWDSLIALSSKRLSQQLRIMIVRKLEVLQKFLYDQYLQHGKGDLAVLINQPFPHDPLFAQLINNRNWFLSNLNDERYAINEKDIVFAAENLMVSDIGYYNYMIYHLQYPTRSKRTLEKIDYHYKRLSWQYFEKEDKRKIGFNLYRELTLLYSKEINDYNKMRESFQQTMANYRLRTQNDSTAAAYMYSAFGQSVKAFNLITTMVEQGSHDSNILTFYLKLAAQLPNEQHYELLKYYRKYLNKQDWCGMFSGEFPVSFQLFDYAPLRELYCQTCEQDLLNQ